MDFLGNSLGEVHSNAPALVMINPRLLKLRPEALSTDYLLQLVKIKGPSCKKKQQVSPVSVLVLDLRQMNLQARGNPVVGLERLNPTRADGWSWGDLSYDF